MEQNPAEQDEKRSTRREILRGGLLIAGAAAVARVSTGGPKEAQADNGFPLILGQQNVATNPTTLNAPPGVPGLIVSIGLPDPNEPGGGFELSSALRGDGNNTIGVQGSSFSRIGVLGQTGTSVVLDPNDFTNFGVYGVSVAGVGVGGRSLENFGIVGETGESVPLDPNEPFPLAGIIGLAGLSGDPNNFSPLAGVIGFAMDPNSTGVLARNSALDGLGLTVQGRALFSSAGQGTIPGGTDRVVVMHNAVSPSSTVLVTLSSDPIGGRRLKFVEAQDGSFVVVLSSKAKVPVDFGFLVVN